MRSQQPFMIEKSQEIVQRQPLQRISESFLSNYPGINFSSGEKDRLVIPEENTKSLSTCDSSNVNCVPSIDITSLDQDELENKFRCLDRKEIELELRVYDSVCINETTEILKQIESYVGSQTLVINDSQFMKAVWKKIKQNQEEIDDAAAANRRRKHIQWERLFNMFALPPISQNPSNREKSKKVKCKKQSNDDSYEQTIPNQKRQDIHGSTSLSLPAIKMTPHTSLTESKEYSTESMYRKAETMLRNFAISKRDSKLFWLKKVDNGETNAKLETDGRLPQINEK